MSKPTLAKALAARREQGRCAFVAFVTAGDPSPASTPALLLALEKAGADVLELGAPFSEPVADGPVIQAASHRALKKGMSLERSLSLLALARKKGLKAPVIVFTYLNPVLAMGVGQFAAKAAKAGAQGALIVDLPSDEAERVSGALKSFGLELVLLASPTTSDPRLAQIGKATGSILYYVSRAGVTGARKGLAPGIAARLAAVKKKSGKPVIVGFGVAQAAQARALASKADGVVVGSALVQAAHEGGVGGAARLARSIASGLKL